VDDGYLGAQLAALAGIATVTNRIKLVTAVIVLPFYEPRQVAEASVVVDLLSHGRLELGVAVGAYQREFELFGVDMRRRGRLLERGVEMLRHGLDEGQIPDGPGGAMVPITPRAVQGHVPILVGGMARAAVRRAVKIGDGTISYDFEHPEENIPVYWQDTLKPELDAAGRSLDDFRFCASLPLWVSDDPERDWHELYLPAFNYQQSRYTEWYGADETDAGMPSTDEPPRIEDHLVGTPDDIAERLVATWRRAHWHDVGFFFRLPGISHERALEQLELVHQRLLPAVRTAAGA
jgi:alkanesulfonate monooxygenase SsuD/methylene tetrahydromethanopterin reductase-like flavin-dependent oxidoreductase (luciferase family)